MKLLIPKNTASYITEIFIQDTASPIGAGLSGIVAGDAGLLCYYHRNTALAPVHVALSGMTIGTYITNGFGEVSRANMRGFYQVCLPDSAWATGAQSVAALISCSGGVPVPIEVQLTDAALGYLAASGISRSSFTLESELSAPPTYPINPVDVLNAVWMRSFQKSETRDTVSYLFKANNSTIWASGLLSDSASVFTQNKFI
jgi:hypothetical protein